MTATSNDRMTTAEVRRAILDMYEVHPPATIAALTGRSVGTIRTMASAMGIKSGGRGKDFDDLWTPREEKQLSEQWGLVTVARLSRMMGRTEAAIMAKASKLGLGRARSREWAASEDQAIRDGYPQNGPKPLAKQLGRSVDSVKHRARKLGVRREAGSHPWVEAERKRYEECRRSTANG